MEPDRARKVLDAARWHKVGRVRDDQRLVQTADALNVLLLSVGGDKDFGPYVSYLKALAIPWVIICDGPVAS